MGDRLHTSRSRWPRSRRIKCAGSKGERAARSRWDQEGQGGKANLATGAGRRPARNSRPGAEAPDLALDLPVRPRLPTAPRRKKKPASEARRGRGTGCCPRGHGHEPGFPWRRAKNRRRSGGPRSPRVPARNGRARSPRNGGHARRRRAEPSRMPTERASAKSATTSWSAGDGRSPVNCRAGAPRSQPAKE